MPLLAHYPNAHSSKPSTESELLFIHEIFQQHFEILEASSPELLEQALALRYQVYCLEKSFEEVSCFPNKIETDNYDQHSLHVLIRYRSTKEAVATVRLVRPNSSSHGNGFPMEVYCNTPPANTPEETRIPSRYLPAEISRFAVSKSARQHIMEMVATSDATSPGGQYDSTYWGRLLYSHLTLELVAAAIHLSDKHRITHWCSLASPALFRTLKRFGISLTPTGQAIEHRGKRFPCVDSLETLLSRVYRAQPDAWRVLTNDGAIWPASGRNTGKAEKATATRKLTIVPPYKTAIQPQIANAIAPA